MFYEENLGVYICMYEEYSNFYTCAVISGAKDKNGGKREPPKRDERTR